MPEGVGYASSNVVAGAGLDLNYVENRVFAYSGLQAATTAVKTYLEFQTGAKTIVGTLQVNSPVDDDDPTVGVASSSEVLVNGVKIALLKTDSDKEQMPASNTLDVVLPPYTNFSVTMLDSANQADRYGSMTFTGKVL